MPRINERIREAEIRVIGADGEQLGVMSPEDALARAVEEGLDLVEVASPSRARAKTIGSERGLLPRLHGAPVLRLDRAVCEPGISVVKRRRRRAHALHHHRCSC